MTGSGSVSCGACKFLRRKCKRECVFAAYFSYDAATLHFSAVHKVFGASNASRMLLHLPEQHRSQAAISLSFEALSRMQDPVHGSVAYMYALQQQIANLQQEIETLVRHLSMKNMSSGIESDSGNSQETNTISTNSLHLSVQEDDHQSGSVDPQDYWRSACAENRTLFCNYNNSFNSYSYVISETQPVMPIPHPGQCDQANALFNLSHYPSSDGRLPQGVLHH